ncbi:hypothetical protein SAMN02799630_00917 [Paenibacillus sp. UNCCL117]|uniref:hypothetical protein n=1 Tax=unclassified Paenibacillus TaxID=185978 RepID=UPI000891D303|nr:MULTISPECIES: hypothetical protein [unclassified Paenibacillus]SDC25222.1 hypothetical protein SAMN04488602_101719 [Paenibacillus sp. cl123]SFW19767.1 hypothetical protein SAMN02799630_00917 [Paenibacillus sp. UNCCL117]
MKNKLAKVLMTGIVASSLIFSAQSVFAYGTPAEPDSSSSPNYFSGIGDWFEGTIVNVEGDDYFIRDTDYFRYVNNTGQTMAFYVKLSTFENPSLDYVIRSIGTSGPSYPIATYSQVHKETGKEVWYVSLPAGHTLDIQVQSNTFFDFDPDVKYSIQLSDTPWI